MKVFFVDFFHKSSCSIVRIQLTRVDERNNSVLVTSAIDLVDQCICETGNMNSKFLTCDFVTATSRLHGSVTRI